MTGTVNCVYETPCGWCSKWDKKCDLKAPESVQTNCDNLEGVTVNKICRSESDHVWECTGVSTAGTTYTCKKCLKQKLVPIVDPGYITVTAKNY